MSEDRNRKMLPDPWSYPGNPITVQYQGPITDFIREWKAQHEAKFKANKEDYDCNTVVQAAWGIILEAMENRGHPNAQKVRKWLMDYERMTFGEKPFKGRPEIPVIEVPGRDVTKDVTNEDDVTKDVTKMDVTGHDVTKPRPLTPAERKRMQRKRERDDE